MQKTFDFHFHLLFKHYIADPKLKLDLKKKFQTKGVAKVLNELIGGAFDSQSAPVQVKDSNLHLGVVSLSSIEYAFVERILYILDQDFSCILPIDHALFDRIREYQTTYWDDFLKILAQHKNNIPALAKAPFYMEFLRRADFKNNGIKEIEKVLSSDRKRRFALSIEGGHNLSNVPVCNTDYIRSDYPELQMEALQDTEDLDFMSLNLCHLSDIPEQRLGGFAQGANKLSQIAFSSDYFRPLEGIGLTELGKKVIYQCLCHPEKPVLIDVKHMSLYTRLEFYRYKERLSLSHPRTNRLPVISSHTGFTFTSIDDYLRNRRYKTYKDDSGGVEEFMVKPENRKIGRTDDKINKGLYANPWTINLFDEEIVEIMASGGMIGLSLDQRILGASNPALDAIRDKYFETEYVSCHEWKKLFRERELPGEEGLFDLFGLAPTKEERHVMLFCMHIVHAVKVGYAHLSWQEGTSPWGHICIGSDYDGLINPINDFEDVTKLDKLPAQLRKYLPLADKYLLFHQDISALQYHKNGTVDAAFLDRAIDQFIFGNGVRFIARFLTNWSEEKLEEARLSGASAPAPFPA